MCIPSVRAGLVVQGWEKLQCNGAIEVAGVASKALDGRLHAPPQRVIQPLSTPREERPCSQQMTRLEDQKIRKLKTGEALTSWALLC